MSLHFSKTSKKVRHFSSCRLQSKSSKKHERQDSKKDLQQSINNKKPGRLSIDKEAQDSSECQAQHENGTADKCGPGESTSERAEYPDNNHAEVQTHDGPKNMGEVCSLYANA